MIILYDNEGRNTNIERGVMIALLLHFCIAFRQISKFGK